MYLADQIIVKLDALFQSHIKNLDFSNMLEMGNTGAYSNWVSPMMITGVSRDNYALRIAMLSIDMETGAALGATISIRTGIDHSPPPYYYPHT